MSQPATNKTISDQTPFDPYGEADRVDRLINELLKEHSPTQTNLAIWTLYHRTVQSTLNLIEKKLEQVAKETA